MQTTLLWRHPAVPAGRAEGTGRQVPSLSVSSLPHMHETIIIKLSRFEPIFLALLKRREVTAEALVKAKAQSRELKTQLSPLKDEIQKLKLQGACLEEKLKLTHIQRTEDTEHYKVSNKGRVC